MNPSFLTLEEVLQIHRDQIARYGGSAGVRDMGLLQSALAQPRATFGGQFLHADLFEMAAAYLFHLVQNHAFVDGNKRAGAVASLVFLTMNDQDIGMTNDELETLVLSVAEGKTAKDAIANFFREHAK
ncbi:MAG: type II toxin-antitoxin system death-on-curing family toxin [Gemmataceae bacterium]|nr:type II toxin-antitoxin system death-on-curing family toxin [Gemmataceae bacterium]